MKIDSEKLKRLRTQQVLSIRELAHRSGVGHEAIILIERGVRQPYPSTIRKLADGLGVPPSELLLQENPAESDDGAGVGPGNASAPAASS